MRTRRMHRVVLLAAFVAVVPVLAGCADFDPDKLDVFGLNDKKKLPGDRKPLFPEGVPGVTQGIPPEYMKGNQPPPDAALALPVEPAGSAPAAAAQTAAAPAQEPKPEAKPKPKPKKTVKRTPKPAAPAAATTTAPAEPAAQSAQQPAAWPAPEQGQSSSTAPWPAAPPTGTFTR